MKKIREWGFPVALILGWVIATGYTISALVDATAQHAVRSVSAVRT
jgi:hypothetical protein